MTSPLRWLDRALCALFGHKVVERHRPGGLVMVCIHCGRLAPLPL